MNNAQKFVFTSLLAVLALEFVSFSKLQSVWGLAFTGVDPNASKAVSGTHVATSASSSQANTASILPAAHPVAPGAANQM
jgi:hypothetical protein